LELLFRIIELSKKDISFLEKLAKLEKDPEVRRCGTDHTASSYNYWSFNHQDIQILLNENEADLEESEVNRLLRKYGFPKGTLKRVYGTQIEYTAGEQKISFMSDETHYEQTTKPKS